MILSGIVGLDAAVGQSAQSLCLGRAAGHARLRRDRLLRRLSEGDEADAMPAFRQAAARARIRDRGVARLLCAHRSSAGRRSRPRWPFPFFKDLRAQSRLVLRRLRRLRHRRRRQCGEPHRRARRPGHRAGDDRGGDLRPDRLSRRQRGVRRLSADPFRAGHRRACGALRRGDRRGPRLPLVQRAAGRDLHGRHRLAGARRRCSARSRSPPSTRSCWPSSAACSCSRRCR